MLGFSWHWSVQYPSIVFFDLQVTFPSLVHIVKLDLSKNLLEELPQNFGDLRNLKHLDLYSNKVKCYIFCLGSQL